jgi:hypothetical protein
LRSRAGCTRRGRARGSNRHHLGCRSTGRSSRARTPSGDHRRISDVSTDDDLDGRTRHCSIRCGTCEIPTVRDSDRSSHRAGPRSSFDCRGTRPARTVRRVVVEEAAVSRLLTLPSFKSSPACVERLNSAQDRPSDEHDSAPGSRRSEHHGYGTVRHGRPIGEWAELVCVGEFYGTRIGPTRMDAREKRVTRCIQ